MRRMITRSMARASTWGAPWDSHLELATISHSVDEAGQLLDAAGHDAASRTPEVSSTWFAQVSVATAGVLIVLIGWLVEPASTVVELLRALNECCERVLCGSTPSEPRAADLRCAQTEEPALHGGRLWLNFGNGHDTPMIRRIVAPQKRHGAPPLPPVRNTYKHEPGESGQTVGISHNLAACPRPGRPHASPREGVRAQ